MERSGSKKMKEKKSAYLSLYSLALLDAESQILMSVLFVFTVFAVVVF